MLNVAQVLVIGTLVTGTYHITGIKMACADLPPPHHVRYWHTMLWAEKGAFLVLPYLRANWPISQNCMKNSVWRRTRIGSKCLDFPIDKHILPQLPY